MDILTHTLSGFAVGTVVASFSQLGFKDKLKIFTISGFAGALPDFDAISLWGRFDSTIGRFFNLTHSGHEIYFSKFWYSHHGFLHSMIAAFLIAILIGLTGYLIQIKFKSFDISGLIQHYMSRKLILIGFISGFLIHLIEDMPTPAAVWSGVNLFWPSKAYIGGSGDIWWWNNYDIFLIVLSVIIINLTLLLIKKVGQFDLTKLTMGIFALGFFFSVIQIKSRDYDFAYSGNTNRYNEFELKSKALQEDILGPRLFNLMVRFDNKLSVYF